MLSEAQRQVISTVNKYLFTLVIGPPGTGKSFTIAALALEFMSKGKSVLIASKTDQAVDVIAKKIEVDLDVNSVALRAGKSDYKKSLISHLKDLLSNTRKNPHGRHDEVDQLDEELRGLDDEVEKMTKEFHEQVTKEFRWGKYVAQYEDRQLLFPRLKMRYIRWRK